MSAKFEIEHIIKERRQEPYIIARHLTPSESFSVPKKSFLNGVEIKSGVNSPRAMDKKGTPRLDLFIFFPVSSKDINFFKEKMVVELTSGLNS